MFSCHMPLDNNIQCDNVATHQKFDAIQLNWKLTTLYNNIIMWLSSSEIRHKFTYEIMYVCWSLSWSSFTRIDFFFEHRYHNFELWICILYVQYISRWQAIISQPHHNCIIKVNINKNVDRVRQWCKHQLKRPCP